MKWSGFAASAIFSETAKTQSFRRNIMTDERFWPALPLEEWQDTHATLHMWTQIVGKIRLTKTPLINHWWNSTLYVSPRGLTTSAIPHDHENFQIDFDF